MEPVGVSSIIRNELEKKGLSQKFLAEQVGVTEQAMSRYVNGSRTPKGAVLVGIANTLGISTDVLLGNNFNAPAGGDDDDAYKAMLDYAAHKGRFLSPDKKAQIVQMLFEGV